MAINTLKLPKFAASLAAESQENRLALLSRTHQEYTANAPSWLVLIDAFEGKGGFLDGSYLWPYSREEQVNFDRRREMARYHNYLEAIVELYVRFVFTQGVKRDSKNAAYNEWLENVDGNGTKINDFLKKLSSLALTTGHAGALIDKTRDEPTGPTLAEEQARVVASVFPATSILDWRHDRSRLVAVKLSEAAPQPGILSLSDDQAPKQYLVWDEEGWARYNGSAEIVDGDVPGLGLVPFVVLRPKASTTSQMLGRALCSNANVIRAIYNRASEEDEVIRAQAFSLMTVEVDKEGNVDETKAQLGNTIGSAKAVVVKGKVTYQTPDQSVPSAIRENTAYLVREVYRIAHVRYQRDGMGVESADSIRLQFADLNEMLQGFSKALAETERTIARSWFSWMTPGGAEASEKAFMEAEVTTTYPDEFFLSDLGAELEAWAEALSLDLGETMAKRIKKKAARRLDPDMPPDVLKVVDAEIDAMSEEELESAGPDPDLGLDPDSGEPIEPEEDDPDAKLKPIKKKKKAGDR